jgi:GntR family transcriptional regulator, histidine utilization repressor
LEVNVNVLKRSIGMTDSIDTKDEIPIFQQIKSHIFNQISNGAWKEGEKIPSEMSLCQSFGASRMTVNRALRELTAEQVLRRVQGAGTYVALQKYQTTIVEIKSIADEIRGRNHVHSCQVVELTKRKPDAELMRLFSGKPTDKLFYSFLVHFEDGVPIQVEKRWVNPFVAPKYLEQNFTVVTPNEYLMKVAPLESVSYRIEATLPQLSIRRLLHIAKGDPSLVLHRTTRSFNMVATTVTMWHPGNSYQFVGNF